MFFAVKILWIPDKIDEALLPYYTQTFLVSTGIYVY